MVAFHFEYSNQAGWKCDLCRRSGLEHKRRCGWLLADAPGATSGKQSSQVAATLVWARKQVSLDTCPKSYITGESETLVEEFFVRRRMQAFDLEELSARQVEAFVILEKEFLEEMNDVQHNASHAL